MVLLDSLVWDSLAAFGLLMVVAYLYAVAQFDYFKKLGIPYIPPRPFVGNFGRVAIARDSLNSAVVPIYEQLKKHRFGGIFMGRSPVFMVCDPELVKQVLTKGFSSFHDRGIPFDEENDPLSATLVNIPGARWKNLRSKLAPTFASGKLKKMFPLMEECTQQLLAVLQESATKDEDVNMTGFLLRYCTDVIGSCAFGIECNSLKNPDSAFYWMSQRVLRPNIFASVRFALFWNSKFFLKWVFPGVYKFFKDVITKTVAYRKNNNVERNDFVHLMMQLQKNDETKTPQTHPNEVIFTDKIMAAQAVVFFIAGLDTIANTIGFALHHLCLDPRMQDDLADEVISVVRNHDDEMTYENLKEMKLLERIIAESLRMYTLGGVLFREVTVPKVILPGSELVIKSGDKILIPVQGLHYDPEIYPDPKKFDPDRFTEEAIAKRHPYSYIPFGEGPRLCIANRFSLVECKLCLASLIKDFKFSLCPGTEIPLELETRTFSPKPKKGFHFKIEKRAHQI